MARMSSSTALATKYERAMHKAVSVERDSAKNSGDMREFVAHQTVLNLVRSSGSSDSGNIIALS